jgi:drug/metabolite transporter (DMT)-like permease
MAEVSFVAILHMFGPIIFTVLSVSIIKDKISKQAKLGLLFAALGGVVILVLPLLLGSGKVVTFGWLPVILSAVAVITTQLDVVFCRKINEGGVPLPVIAGLGLIGIFIVGLAVALLNGGFEALNILDNLPLGDWWLLIYIAIIGSVLGSLLPVKVYEKIGTASQAAIDYLYYVLMIILPVLVFGEVLSWEMVVGAILVMAGIVLTRVHHRHHPHSRSRQ